MKSSEGKKQNPLRVFVVDDHPILREGIIRILSGDMGIQVVGDCGDGNEALEFLQKSLCDLVILDITVPGLDGFRIIDYREKFFKDTKILVLTMHTSHEYVDRCLKKHVEGYILKNEASEYLLWAIRQIKSGNRGYSPRITEAILDSYAMENTKDSSPISILTKREKEILRLVSKGCTNLEIGRELDISERTVESHRSTLMKKIGARNIADLIRYAMEHKVV